MAVTRQTNPWDAPAMRIKTNLTLPVEALALIALARARHSVEAPCRGWGDAYLSHGLTDEHGTMWNVGFRHANVEGEGQVPVIVVEARRNRFRASEETVEVYFFPVSQLGSIPVELEEVVPLASV